MIERKEYLEQLKLWREKQLIKVVSGVRRCGKSTLFALYAEYLKRTGVADEQIISINLEDVEFDNLLDYKSLYNYVKERLCKDKFTYVFIDEVQQCKDFEKAIDSLFIKPNVDVYITGSNAFLLSGELATLLSGRYVEIKMLPLSFAEFSEIVNDDRDAEKVFRNYIKLGGFPYVTALGENENAVRTYIDGIYNTILIKDVAKREGITDIAILEDIIKFLCSNVGSPVSIKKISDYINANGRNISVNSVERYIHALIDSYIFYKADRYDIKGKQLLKTLGKYYVVDTSLRNLLLSNSAADFGHVLENIVYLELLRRGYKVNIGKLAEKEVDFVARGNDGITYYQVSATVLDEKTLQRELEPLDKIPDHYPKILLTMDIIGSGMDYNGIRQLNVIDWLSKVK